MPRSSGKRGYVEPVAALAAVFVLGVGLTLYAGTLAESRPTDDRESASAILHSVVGQAETLGVIRPGALQRVRAPSGWSLNLTLTTSAGRWTRGDTPPPGADRSSRRVSVRVGPGSVRPGRIRVAVW